MSARIHERRHGKDFAPKRAKHPKRLTRTSATVREAFELWQIRRKQK